MLFACVYTAQTKPKTKFCRHKVNATFFVHVCYDHITTIAYPQTKPKMIEILNFVRKQLLALRLCMTCVCMCVQTTRPKSFNFREIYTENYNKRLFFDPFTFKIRIRGFWPAPSRQITTNNTYFQLAIWSDGFFMITYIIGAVRI